MSGYEVESEVDADKGRIDAVLKKENEVIVVEIKYGKGRKVEGIEEPEVVVVGETQGMLLRYGYEVLLVENGLEVEVKGEEVNPKTKSLTQSMSGSIDFVSMGMGEEVGREIRGVGEEVKTYMMMRGEGVESKIGEGVKGRGIKMVGGVGKKIRVI
jgi:hypothetical protein